MSMNITGSLLSAIPTGMDPVSMSDVAGAGSSGGFSDVLKGAVNQVSTLQNNAERQVNTLLQGGSSDMSKVMISVEKADVAFQLMMQVRNKIVSAYQDIEKMQF
jgi:flagellar hook-basal body complex protein FliE